MTALWCKPVIRAAGPKNEIYLVGGYTRDLLLKKRTKDIDIVVRRSPEHTAKVLAQLLNASWITLDADAKIYRVIQPKPGYNIDIALLQGSSIEEDLSRRDFTINAIARKLSSVQPGPPIDPFGGIHDIRRKRIQFISERAIPDDPLRLIRAFRFTAELEYSIVPSSRKLITKYRLLITRPAGERVRNELYRILVTPRSGAVITLMARAGLLEILFPELNACRGVAPAYYPRGGLIIHCLRTAAEMDFICNNLKTNFGPVTAGIRKYLDACTEGGYPRYATIKLAALLHDIGKPSTAKMVKGRLRFFHHEERGAELISTIAARLKLSRKTTSSLQAIARAHMRPGNLAYVETVTDRAVHRFFSYYGYNAVGILLASLADRFSYLTPGKIAKKNDRHHRTILLLLDRYYRKRRKILPKPLINGNMLMEKLRIPEGPEVGRILKAVLEAQAAGKLHSRSQAIDLARNLLKR